LPDGDAYLPSLQTTKEEEMTTESQKVVDTLNSLLRGEISAVETYRQALTKLNHSGARPELEDCHRSHEHRMATLREHILRLGGVPADDSGAWGTFAKLVEGGAAAFGEKAALAALEEGEDHGLKLYREEVSKLDVSSRHLVEMALLPAQERTHRTMSTLKHTLH
jgi:demethoxyubiquinone hydroxylase (CLK1/Coq7/Cat5 family)